MRRRIPYLQVSGKLTKDLCIFSSKNILPMFLELCICSSKNILPMFLELKIHKSLTYLLLTGLHCTNTNESLDYCIEHNKWCVKFIDETTDGNVPYDLIEDFTIRFWLKYTSKMVRPCLFVTLSPN